MRRIFHFLYVVASCCNHRIGQCASGVKADQNSDILDNSTLLESSRLDIEGIVTVPLLVQNGTKVKEDCYKEKDKKG